MSSHNQPRVLAADDSAAMADLHAQSFAQGWPETDMAGHIVRDICIGLGTPLSGFIIIRNIEDQAEILTITVSPKQRRKGMGCRLLETGFQYAFAAGVTVLFLEVAEDNAAAIALYHRAGFEPIGRRPAYYKRPDGRIAALTFRKSLDGFRPNG